MERSSLNPFREIALLWWLWRAIRREQSQIVHGFTIKSAVYGALAARLAGAARISAIAGMGYVFASNEPKARMLRPFVKILMRISLGGARARLILQNGDDRAFFEQTGLVRKSAIRLIRGSGVDCARFLPPSEDKRKSPDAPFQVVLAARMLWDKGIGEFVEAARILKKEGRNVRFILAGTPDPGNPAAIEEKQLLAWRAADLTEWLGHVDNMPELFATADLVVLPSCYGEGLPKSLIEAAACARPLIATDIPGCREAITHEEDGLLIPVRDAAALAQAIARLQDNPDLARRLGEAARVKALAFFDERVIIAQTIAVYDELAKIP